MWNFESIDREPSLLRFRSGHSAPPSRIRFQDAFGRWILSAGNDRAFRLFSIFHEGQNVELSQGSIGAKSRELGVRPETLKLPPILQFATLETRQREWAQHSHMSLELLIRSILVVQEESHRHTPARHAGWFGCQICGSLSLRQLCLCGLRIRSRRDVQYSVWPA